MLAAGSVCRVRARIVVFGVMGAVTCALLSGCGVKTCSGADMPPPSVILDASPWRSAHPEATLKACLDGGDCMKVDDWAQLAAKVPVGKMTSFRLTVSGTENGTSILAIARNVTIPVAVGHTACGDTRTQVLSVTLAADGTLDASGRVRG